MTDIPEFKCACCGKHNVSSFLLVDSRNGQRTTVTYHPNAWRWDCSLCEKKAIEDVADFCDHIWGVANEFIRRRDEKVRGRKWMND